ncbi:spore cortex biosynthesis protein YabQ [Desulfitobacterium metallireducens DSM 15288]|uniref:Spore cortex biosynthesis protein YabQ n=2 Tax=Desulfitobacterium TaxID=36853 RepID=W0E4R4_9FIRM|nr:spore cortex biosynthesis protein YabQ [Desulfitobacterium metallireducens]AHF05727.1 spore cortex biosynthesis protein YabQ [Desulfitobacterium metallireducens DSM 15288]
MAGVVVGVCFDFYRSLRRYLRWGRVSTWAGDLLFSLITLVILFRFFQRANALDFRIYILWGSILGLFLYLRLLSRVLIKGYLQLFRLFSYLFWLLRQGLRIPVRGVFILMRPPYALLHWFSFLVYRILEAVLAQPLRQTRARLYNYWNTLFSPRTKG